ncbi:MAG: Rieske (2Fe-2S) protein [Candidatus Lutacidiplasmatales archaeon]
MAWRKTGVAAVTLSPGTLREVTIDAATILLARIGSNIYALDGICTHEGGVLSEGTLNGESVVCPLHGATYALKDGRVLADPDGIVPPAGGAAPLKTFPTKTIDGMIQLDLPD